MSRIVGDGKQLYESELHFYLFSSTSQKLIAHYDDMKSPVLFAYILFVSSVQCYKLMIPHGLLGKYPPDYYLLSTDYVVEQAGWLSGNYSLIHTTNDNQTLAVFEPKCVHSCENTWNKCFLIFTPAPEPKGLLQLCQDDLVAVSSNGTRLLSFVSTTTGQQVVVNEAERTRNESTWTFTKTQPIFTLAALEMQPFRAMIANVDNTKVLAYINYERPKYPYDDFAYEFMATNHSEHDPYEFGLLLAIAVIIDDLRTYPKTADERY